MAVNPGGPPLRKKMTDGLAKPKSLKELPSYIGKKVKGFVSRLFYIISLVWRASPAILITMCILCLVDGVLPVAGAYISKDLLNNISRLIGEGSGSADFDAAMAVLSPVIFILIVQLIYQFCHRVLGRLNHMVTAIAGELVVNHIKLQIISKSRTVDQKSFDDPDFYEKLENANREAGMRPIGILSATFNVISAIISVCSFIVVLATLSPWAPVIIICASLPGAFVNYYFKNRNFHYIRRHSAERRKMNYYSSIMTNKDSAKEIKVLGLGDTFIDKYKQAFSKYYKGLKTLIMREGISQVAISLVYVLASCVLFAFVAYKVVFEGGEIGDYSLYSGALNSITSYVSIVVTATATIYEGTLFIENMIDYMKEEPTVTSIIQPPRMPERNKPHVIEFRDVSFRYTENGKNVINHVNLTLRSDESVVLVGLNGAGKSTLLKLVMRLYDATEGTILLDGYDIREYDTAALYDMYGIIFQDFGKYADSVSENIRFGDVRSESTEERIKAAGELGNADAFIGELKHGYETQLTRLFDEDGIELSGGQWQKLSIARAFYKNSDILIMDEPTASLDPLAEQDVFNRFEMLSKGKISIFVSHRLGGAVTAGKIVVLENGEIVESGTHDELMSKKEKYYLLFTTQAKRYIGEQEL